MFHRLMMRTRLMAARKAVIQPSNGSPASGENEAARSAPFSVTTLRRIPSLLLAAVRPSDTLRYDLSSGYLSKVKMADRPSIARMRQKRE